MQGKYPNLHHSDDIMRHFKWYYSIFLWLSHFFTFPQGLITSNSKQYNLLLFNTVKGVAGLVSERQEKIMSKDEKVAQSHYPLLLVINFEEFMKWQVTYVECFILAVRVVKKVMRPLSLSLLAQTISLIYGCAITLSIVFSVSKFFFFSSNEDILVS